MTKHKRRPFLSFLASESISADLVAALVLFSLDGFGGAYYFWYSAKMKTLVNLQEIPWLCTVSYGASAFCIVASVLMTGFLLFSLVRKKRILPSNRFLLCLILAINAYLVSQIVMQTLLYQASALLYPQLFLLIFSCFLLYLSLYLIGILFPTGKAWYIFVTLLSAVFLLAQIYIAAFRGSPLKPVDLVYLRSAMDVKDEYPLFLDEWICILLVNTVAAVVLLARLPIKAAPPKKRVGAAAFLAGWLLFFVAFATKSYPQTLEMSYLGTKKTYGQAGYALMFYYDAIYNNYGVPQNYSVQNAQALLETEQPADCQGATPNIICIMNESWADFQRLHTFDTNKKYTEHFDQICQEGISGYVTVSPYGGNSAYSEYEFLTGNTMHFIPDGVSPFIFYLNEPKDSHVRYLNALGYHTMAINPSPPTLWSCGNAYQNLGFESAVFQVGYELEFYIGDKQSDQVLFQRVIEEFENKPNQPVFYWVTTMQNHGSYDTGHPLQGITLTDIQSPQAEAYLSSLFLSDQAVGELIDYFRDVEEDVIVLMFGDHFPNVPGFPDALLGKSVDNLTLQETVLMHQTPFFIWSNRGLEAQKLENISLNYLFNQLCQTAGIPLSPYCQFLEQIRTDIPAISIWGCQTSDGSWYRRGEVTTEESAKSDYNIVQYYKMFDESIS